MNQSAVFFTNDDQVDPIPAVYNIKPKTSPLTQPTSSGQAHHLDWIYVITLRILTTFWILYEKRPLPAHTRRLGFKLGLSAPHSGRISSHWIYDTFFIEHKFGFTGWRADGPAHTHTLCARGCTTYLHSRHQEIIVIWRWNSKRTCLVERGNPSLPPHHTKSAYVLSSVQ